MVCEPLLGQNTPVCQMGSGDIDGFDTGDGVDGTDGADTVDGATGASDGSIVSGVPSGSSSSGCQLNYHAGGSPWLFVLLSVLVLALHGRMNDASDVE